MLVVGLGFGFLGRTLERARHDAEVVEKLGERFPVTGFVKSTNNKWGRVIKLGLVVDHVWFGLYLSPADLATAKMKKPSLAGVEELARLRWLDIEGCQMTNADLGHLKELTNLRYLDIQAVCATVLTPRPREFAVLASHVRRLRPRSCIDLKTSPPEGTVPWTRYLALLGVSARRDITDAEVLRGKEPLTCGFFRLDPSFGAYSQRPPSTP